MHFGQKFYNNLKKTRQLHFEDERADLAAYLEKINANRHPISLFLDGLTDFRNVGLLFRLADAARVEKIYLYNCVFNLENKKIHRTSRATINYVPYEIIEDFETVKTLSKQKEFVALEITTESKIYTTHRINPPTVLVIGSERNGVSKVLLELCNTHIHLPMLGVKTSMNVLAASSIAVYHWLEQLDETS